MHLGPGSALARAGPGPARGGARAGPKKGPRTGPGDGPSYILKKVEKLFNP